MKDAQRNQGTAPRMSLHTDRLSRRAAAGVQESPDRDGSIWAEILRSARVPVRPQPTHRAWAVAAGLCLLLLCLFAWSNMGTEDSALVPAGGDPIGASVFSGPGPTDQSRQMTDSAGPLPEDQRIAEEIRAKLAGGDYKLLNVRGTTIRGQTLLAPRAEVQTRAGPRTSVVDLDIPVNSIRTEAALAAAAAFWQTRFGETLRAIKEGRAGRLDPIAVEVAGRVVMCDRWLLSFPEFGDVVYWDGKP